MTQALITHIQKLITPRTIAAFKKEGPAPVAKRMYEALPVYLKLIVPEKEFIDFCMAQQETIFSKTVLVRKPAKKMTDHASSSNNTETKAMNDN
jgi:hypothetical protein